MSRILHRHFFRFVLSFGCMCMLAGCASSTKPFFDTSAEDQMADSNIFVAEESLNEFLDDQVYQRVLSEPFGAEPPEIPFFNQEIVCLSHYNGLLIFDIETGMLKDAIDTEAAGLGATQGDFAAVVRGNDDFVVIMKADGTDPLVYEIASSRLGKFRDGENPTYTEIHTPSQAAVKSLNLPAPDATVAWSMQASKDGIVVCTIPLNDLSGIHFKIYGTDYHFIREFPITAS